MKHQNQTSKDVKNHSFFFAAVCIFAAIIGFTSTSFEREVLAYEPASVNVPKLSKIEPIKAIAKQPEVKENLSKGVIREISAYNVGDPSQTDDSPCIGAAGKDLCKLLDQGINVCAANFVKLGSRLKIDKIGECIVLDRMNSRYANTVDIAMRLDEKERALNFGRQYLEVTEL